MRQPTRNLPKGLLPAAWVVGLIGMHLSVLYGQPAIILIILAAAASLSGLARLYKGGSRWVTVACFAGGAASAVVAWYLFGGGGTAVRIVVIPAIVTPAVIAAGFTRSLLPGREPLITRFARLERGTLSAEIERYSRRLTVIWAALCWLMALETLVLGLFADLAVWSWFANIANPAVLIAFFVGQILYGGLRYGRHSAGGLSRTVMRVLRLGNWT